MSRSLWCIKFEGSVSFFRFFQVIDDYNIEIIETTPLGIHTVAVFFAPTDFSDNIRRLLNSATEAMEIRNPHDDLISGYLNVKNSEIKNSVYVYETDFLGTALQVTNEALVMGLELVEIRHPRIENSKTLVLLNGQIEIIQQFIKQVNSRINLNNDNFVLIEKPSQCIKSFYNF